LLKAEPAVNIRVRRSENGACAARRCERALRHCNAFDRNRVRDVPCLGTLPERFMAQAKLQDRPLSPHLQIYRLSWTMAMSIVHRVTGAANYFGAALVAVWLVAMASGPRSFDKVQWFFGSWLGLLILFGYTWSLIHHMLGGVRHLVWDFGHGMGPGERFAMARFTLYASVPLTILIWIVAFAMR
jgi:succinate dehydrogenase / fumarate reductase, cytochrome b subunit